MIITRTPFRVTLGGGGTDLPAYYAQHGGFVFSAAINKYMFINVNRPVVDDLLRVKYSRSETVASLDELQHEIAREALRMNGIDRGIEIISLADVPAGTGLGSSSCYAVGLLHALHTLRRDPIGFQELAEEACDLEINQLHKPIGKQDQYLAAFGGLTVLDIDQDGRVRVRQPEIPRATIDDLERNMLFFYTGIDRSNTDILREQSAGAARQGTPVVESLHRIKDMGYQILEYITSGNLTDFGLAMDRHWHYKKQMSSKISNPNLDRIYEVAKQSGALGGKISGAGGGGFFVFYIESGHARLRKAMSEEGLREMRYHFDFEGSKVLLNLMDGEYATGGPRACLAHA